MTRYALAASVAFLSLVSVRAGDYVAGKLIIFNDNGGWCWFQDQRVIVRDGTLLIGSVASASGTGGAERDGNIELVQESEVRSQKSEVRRQKSEEVEFPILTPDS